LLENWVEERAVASIDPTDLNGEVTCSAQVFKDGHLELLTRNTQQPVDGTTTMRYTYQPPPGPQVRLIGARQEALQKMLYEQVSKEVHEEFNPPPPTPDYKSVTHNDFNKEDFISTQPAPTAHHDVVMEQPVTFWSDHRDVVHGVSQKKTCHHGPFNKNSAFSKPIDECWDQPKPYEQDCVPNM